MEGISQAEFARRLGVQRSYVHALKEAGRLVLTSDGKRVLVEESLQRLEETADPRRADVRERWAAYRGGGLPVENFLQAESTSDPTASDELSLAQWRARKEAALAREAETKYRLEIGELVPVETIEALGLDAGSIYRVRIEAIPAQLSSQPAEPDQRRITDALRQEIESALAAAEDATRRRMTDADPD